MSEKFDPQIAVEVVPTLPGYEDLQAKERELATLEAQRNNLEGTLSGLVSGYQSAAEQLGRYGEVREEAESAQEKFDALPLIPKIKDAFGSILWDSRTSPSSFKGKAQKAVEAVEGAKENLRSSVTALSHHKAAAREAVGEPLSFTGGAEEGAASNREKSIGRVAEEVSSLKEKAAAERAAAIEVRGKLFDEWAQTNPGKLAELRDSKEREAAFEALLASGATGQEVEAVYRANRENPVGEKARSWIVEEAKKRGDRALLDTLLRPDIYRDDSYESVVSSLSSAEFRGNDYWQTVAYGLLNSPDSRLVELAVSKICGSNSCSSCCTDFNSNQQYEWQNRCVMVTRYRSASLEVQERIARARNVDVDKWLPELALSKKETDVEKAAYILAGSYRNNRSGEGDHSFPKEMQREATETLLRAGDEGSLGILIARGMFSSYERAPSDGGPIAGEALRKYVTEQMGHATLVAKNLQEAQAEISTIAGGLGEKFREAYSYFNTSGERFVYTLKKIYAEELARIGRMDAERTEQLKKLT